METALEYKLTNTHKADMIAWLKAHPEHFEEALKLALSDKQPYSWRAAWLLWSYIDKNDARIKKHINKIIELLPIRKDNMQRELLIILDLMDLNDKQQARVFDICIQIWKQSDKNPSLRHHAYKLLVEISNNHPGLNQEIKSLTDPYYLNTFSDTMKKAIRKLEESSLQPIKAA